MRRLIALTIKEFRQLSRDHLTLRMIVMVPLMQMTIFGYAINFDVKHLPMVVFDESRSYESRELVALRFIEEMSYGEIASTMGQTEASLRGKVFRALRQLRRVRVDRPQPVGGLDQRE